MSFLLRAGLLNDGDNVVYKIEAANIRYILAS